MKTFIAKLGVIALLVSGGVLALARTADAAHVLVEVLGPAQIEVGRPAELQIALRTAEDGLPVANALVTVYSHASFAGVTSEIEMGTAVTDERGVAVLNFTPRAAGSHELRIEHEAPGGIEHETTTTTISVAGVSQLYTSTSGIQVPGLNVWLIILVVATVWFLLFSVGVRVFAIARAEGAGKHEDGASRPVVANVGARGA